MTSGKKIYLDYNATTPVDPRVVEVMLPYFSERFGNASSDHVFGWEADEAVENSRESISKLVNCKASEITFTSGATEAANIALFGFCKRNRYKGNHIITCKTEHKAILDTMNALENEGFDITYLDVDPEGKIDPEELKNSFKSKTILICLMLANNETGLLHPIAEIQKLAGTSGIKLMCDITQAVGKIPVDLNRLGIDMAVFSSHKLYGPKGAGALYISKKNKPEIDPVVFGGGQEKGLRPGTLNVPAIVGFGKAAEIAFEEMDKEAERVRDLRNEMEELLKEIEDVSINCRDAERLPNTSNITFRNINGTKLLRKLNKLAVSRGSACSSNTLRPSHVLKAMGLSDEEALSSLRISLGRNTNEEDIQQAVEEIREAVKNLKAEVV
ncbi:cysteine desulfurase family protein [Gramella sp. KN1008]|uniref:cysteine desulfurase family protein n=1 Tax=Gramella sp. KN1008 TaxID=2529298 RepID=UPI00103C9C1A|nr:cysteine desulfurase family protein [Gramella sp. KN1008]TBW27150.1 cysteine desulfurase [Gramella sp. KN1008]